MKYIKSDYVKIEEIEFCGNTYYKIGSDDCNIVVGLGGLMELMKQSKNMIDEIYKRLD